jgi:succinate dehydrogenase hydrophobic anchor subunit
MLLHFDVWQAQFTLRYTFGNNYKYICLEKTHSNVWFFLYFLFIFVIQKTNYMYQFIQKFHSGWAYLALLLLVVAVVNALIGMLSKREFTAGDRKVALLD